MTKKDNIKASLKKPLPKVTKKKAKENNSVMITPTQIDNITREVLAVTSTLLKKLTPEQIAIAKDVSKTNVNYNEVCRKHNINRNDLDKLMSEPSFVTEVKRITYQDGFADKEKRVRLNSDIIKLISDVVFEEEFTDRLRDLSADKTLKALKDFIDLQSKLVEGEQVVTKIDITQIIKGKIQEDRIKIEDSGKIKIKNKYPVINESTGEIEGEWSDE